MAIIICSNTDNNKVFMSQSPGSSVKLNPPQNTFEHKVNHGKVKYNTENLLQKNMKHMQAYLYLTSLQ